MRRSKTLEKLRSSRCARVCGMGPYLPFYIRYAAHFRFDAIWLDLEHRAMSQREVQSILAMCQQHDIDCMVRAPPQGRTRLYRFLEDGATGFMVPFVSNADIARHIVEAVKFPPQGNRGLDGAGLDADFGIEAWKPDSTYLEDANQQTFVVGQIETAEALDELDDIAAVPGLDVLFVGPADLGLRLGEGGELDAAVQAVADAASRHGKAWGIAGGTPDQLSRYRQMGAQMLVAAGEFALVKVLEEGSKVLDETVE